MGQKKDIALVQNERQIAEIEEKITIINGEEKRKNREIAAGTSIML